jgi:1,4-dihydroxy-2-naphthoate polyprenyltransferase
MSRQWSLKAKVWWGAFRFHFVPPSIFPAVLGSLVSWAAGEPFLPLFFVLVLAAVVVNHIGLNMTDDYFDYKHSVDKLKPNEKNPYTGGSGTLSSGAIRPRNMFIAFMACYAMTVGAGFYLVLTRGLPILVFGVVGVFCAFFYTAPPISFGHHSLGEVAMLVCFGPVIGLGAFFVQAQALTLEVFLATLPMGIMLFSMIVINEIPDFEEDKQAGKLTLVAKFGKLAGVKLYLASWICTYSAIVGAVILRAIPVFALIALISLPLVYSSFRILHANVENPAGLAPANLAMIGAHSVTAFALIAAYSLQGLLNGSDPTQLALVLVALAVAYAPVAVSLAYHKRAS